MQQTLLTQVAQAQDQMQQTLLCVIEAQAKLKQRRLLLGSVSSVGNQGTLGCSVPKRKGIQNIFWSS